MRKIGISPVIHYEEHFCFPDPPVVHRYGSELDLPWRLVGADVLSVIFTGNGRFRRGCLEQRKAFSSSDPPVIIGYFEVGPGCPPSTCAFRCGPHGHRGPSTFAALRQPEGRP